ncbi:MAG TPA: hypothetical protein VFE24_09770 [Pirellulales bacterium]|nr:hypothetical protein [Pirellulales bacterium]
MDGPRRVAGQGHSGDWGEFVRVDAGIGTSVLIRHDLAPAPIIAELSATVWVKADRPGLQIMGRIALPRTVDPRTGKPISAYLRGTSYTQVGSWQQLRLEGLPSELTRYAHALRSELKSDADVREAYLDQIVLNVYGGQGQTNVVLNDLAVSGCVGRIADPHVQPAGLNALPTASKPPDIQQQGASLLIDGKPFFPRGVEYQGEPLSYLQRLGFNTVFLNSAPSAEVLQDAAKTKMWIVAPPPGQANATPDGELKLPSEFGPEYDRVLAWDLGRGLSGKDLNRTINVAKQIRAADQRMNRLLICSAEAELRSFSRQADVLLTQRLPLGTTLELADYAIWLRERPRLARPGTPSWTVIQTQLPPRLQEQQALLSHGRVLKAVAEEESIRLLVRSALAAGVRGVCFQSETRLDGSDAETRMRAMAIALINVELDLLEPWAAGGSFLATAASNSNEITGAVLQTDRAKLLVPMRLSQGAQDVPRPITLNGLKFIVPGVPETNQVFELTPTGLQTLTHRRVAGGVSIELGETGLSGLILMTQDPLVVNALTKRAAALAPLAAQWQRDLAAASFVLVQSLDARLTSEGHGFREAQELLGTARARLQQADAALTANEPAVAYLKAQQAANALDLIKRTQWEMAAGLTQPAPLKTKTEKGKPTGAPTLPVSLLTGSVITTPSPFIAAYSTLPQHWELREEMRVSRPGENRLSGGDFEDLNRMIQAGWQHFQFNQPEVKTDVELSPQGAVAGRFGLHLRAVAEVPQAVPALLESSPVWINSPPVMLEAGVLFAITGKVKINSPITGSVDGLMIIDSIGGDGMAERIGATQGWKDFTMVRVAPAAGPVSLTFALTGLGEAYVDEVEIRPLQRAAAVTTAPAPQLQPSSPQLPYPQSPYPQPPDPRRQAFGLAPTLR